MRVCLCVHAFVMCVCVRELACACVRLRVSVRVLFLVALMRLCASVCARFVPARLRARVVDCLLLGGCACDLVVRGMCVCLSVCV